MSTRTVNRVAVVGAGPGGIAAAKYLLAENVFQRIDIYERRSSMGGVWDYTPEAIEQLRTLPQTSPHRPMESPSWKWEGTRQEARFLSPMYDQLETNIPHPLMQFSDASFANDPPLFPSRQQVFLYLEDYGSKVSPLVRYSTEVVDVRPNPGQDCRDWIVTAKDLTSERITEESYDAVVIANGHYEAFYIPDLKGLSAWNERYPGAITHSKFYRSPQKFRDKKTVVVGSSASGLDIGSQVSKVCRSPLLVSQRTQSAFYAGPDPLKREMPEIVEFQVDRRAIKFSNGVVEEDVEAVIFCTGYLYSYPWLSALQPPVVQDGSRTEHVYQHIFYTPRPTLAFVGLPQKIVPFPLSESQASVIARVWANRLTLPCREEMEEWETRTLQECGSKDFHSLFSLRDVDYINELHAWSLQAETGTTPTGKVPPYWGERERWMRENNLAIRSAYMEQGENRTSIRRVEQLGFDFDEWKKNEQLREPSPELSGDSAAI